MVSQVPDTKDKIVAMVSYLTLGIWGFIELLISRTPAPLQKDYVKFHCYQSILIGILYSFIPYGVSVLCNLLIQFFSLLPDSYLITNALGNLHAILQGIVKFGSIALILYCAIISAQGKYTNIPYISQVINRMLR